MMYLEAFPAEFRLGFALVFAAVAAVICWRWPHAAGRWWLIAAAFVAVWQPLTGAELVPIRGRNPGSAQPQSWPMGDYWLLASLLIIYGQTLCLPACNTRPARRWFANLLGSWGVYCLLLGGGSSTNASAALVGKLAIFSAGLVGLGLAFGFWQELQAGGQKDWWLTAAKNVGLALVVGWLALVVLAFVSSGYALMNLVIVLGILGGSVAVGLGVTPPSSQHETQRESPDVQLTATAAASAPPTPSLSGKEALLKGAPAASPVPTPPADLSGTSGADIGTSPTPPATPGAVDSDKSAPPETANRGFSFGAFAAACFVMVLVAWIAMDLAAPYRGPRSGEVTPLGTHPYVQDQRPVNRLLAAGIVLAAVVIAKVAWRPGWRSFAAGILVSGLLLALLALGLHR